jgi:hypothetical protein
VKGLAFRKTAEAIAAFVREYGAVGPRRAVLCTYNLDPTRFEAVVLPELTRRGKWFRTLVMADQAQLQKADVLTRRSTVAPYELAPVRVRGSGVFHAKLIVLQAGPRVLVGIGSANLTAGGLGGNLELMLFTSNDRTDGQASVGAVMQFLFELSQRRKEVLCPDSARRFVERLSTSVPHEADGQIAHTLKEPLIERLAAGRPRHVVRATVVSPWHSSLASRQGIEPEVLRRVTKALGARPTVYTEGQDGRGPDVGRSFSVRILKADAQDDIESGQEDDDEVNNDRSRGPRRPSALHAKVYLAANRRGATLWFGSANCTTPGLLRAVSRGGNVEILMRVDLGRRELARIESDLDQMFETPRGVSPMKINPRIPSPRGLILAAYVSSWNAKAHMKLELVEAQAGPVTLRLSRTRERGGAISVNVPAGKTSAHLGSASLAKLLVGEETPPVLWEHVGGDAVAFPVSVGCISDSLEPVEQLDDLLDELKGRIPAAFRSRARRPGDDPADDPAGEDEDQSDPELALLTKTAHEGALDQIAVRVELLRRRLAQSWRSVEALVHYRRVIEALVVDRPLKTTLIRHLGIERGPQ